MSDPAATIQAATAALQEVENIAKGVFNLVMGGKATTSDVKGQALPKTYDASSVELTGGKSKVKSMTFKEINKSWPTDDEWKVNVSWTYGLYAKSTESDDKAKTSAGKTMTFITNALVNVSVLSKAGPSSLNVTGAFGDAYWDDDQGAAMLPCTLTFDYSWCTVQWWTRHFQFIIGGNGSFEVQLNDFA